MRKIDGDQSWSKVDFGAGRVIFLDEMEKEDMLQVEYPIIQYTAADKKRLPDLLAEAVRCAEEVSGNCLSNVRENQETTM